MATIRITNLKLRTIIGTNDWERECKQDILINIKIGFDATKASKSDNIKDTIDYKLLTKRIIGEIEPSSFFLLEKLAKHILEIKILWSKKQLSVSINRLRCALPILFL